MHEKNRIQKSNTNLSRHTISKYSHIFFSSLALICVFIFAFWWFNPQHIPHNFTGILRIFDILLFLLVSYIIWHPIIMEVLTWCISSHIKDIRKQKPVPGSKVAFITTIVPKNESIDLLHKCLPAMVNAKYPHDTWLLDEGNNDEVKKICQIYGVFHFSRSGIAQFNTPVGKYTKTKGGNHNSWYDTYGYYYDFVAQIDTDFVPKKNFLTKTLGYFRDPQVAFIGTPQIYGNIENSLVAQGAAEQQYNFYGAVLRGLSGMGMTLLIGANHVIRVSAFKKVGHYTAHITEDLITGMKLHAHNYKSIYIPYPLAIGEGPTTWESYFNQQLRWAFGCMDILFNHSAKYFKKMGLRQILYYFFLEQHYFSGLIMALSIILLNLYFIFGWRSANVDTFKFLLFYSLILLLCWLMSVWLQRFNVEKGKEGELQLAGKIISIAAWPIWFIAFVNVLIGRRLIYKVTPKGENNEELKTSNIIFIPHFIFALIAITGLTLSWFTHNQSIIMIVWAISSIVLMAMVPFVMIFITAGLKISKKVSSFIQNKYSCSTTITIQTKELIADCIFLSFIVSLSLISYVTKIGFYSDDWSFLGNFTLSKNHSILGLFQTATTPNTFMRPMQNLYDALLFWLFRTQPLGYQIVNAFVFLGIVLLLYMLLRQIQIPRIISVTIPLIYSLLPNYSTDRFWYAAFQINLSILFFLLSTFAGLKAFSKDSRALVWKITSIVSLIMSVLSYEVALPLVFLNLLLFWNSSKNAEIKEKKNYITSNPTIFITLNIIVLFYLIIFKLKTTIRLGSFNYPGDLAHLLISITQTNFWMLGLRLPYIWGDILSHYTNPTTLFLSITLFLAVFFYLYYIVSLENTHFPSTSFMRNLIISGFLIYILGYAIFFANNQVGFSPTGIDNRVAIAATLGIAFILVGFFGWVSGKILPARFSHWFFCVLIAIMSTGGYLVINTLASYWESAYSQDRGILSDIQTHFSSMPSNTTLILDGVCPYDGPGVVFESEWDLKGALQTIYHNPTIQADIVTPRMKVTNKSIDTQIYTFKAEYPYKKIVIYNYKNKQKYDISNEQDANAYFEKYNPNYSNGCPPSIAGNGVSVFD